MSKEEPTMTDLLNGYTNNQSLKKMSEKDIKESIQKIRQRIRIIDADIYDRGKKAPSNNLPLIDERYFLALIKDMCRDELERRQQKEMKKRIKLTAI